MEEQLVSGGERRLRQRSHPRGAPPCVQEAPCPVWGALTTLSLKPRTGRQHQLRRHCAEVLQCGILGDPYYGRTRGVCHGQASAAHHSEPPGAPDGQEQGASDPQEEGTQLAGGDGSSPTQLTHPVPGSHAIPLALRPAFGGARRVDVLADGRVATLCLCAAELRLTHPITGQELHVHVPEPGFFEEYRRAAAGSAATSPLLK